MKDFLRKIVGVEAYLVRVETWVLATIFFSMLAIACIQVFLRKFGTALGWADEFNQNMVIYVGLLGAVLAVKEGRHLTMDILTSFLPKKFKPYLSFIVYLFVLVIISMLFRLSWMYSIQYKIPFENSDMLFSWLPKAYLSVIFPVSFALIFIHYVFKILELFAGMGSATDAPKLH